jgi:dihydroorotate dehydrogenase electron transfer subunit
MSVARVELDPAGLRLGFLYAPVGIGTLALAALGAGALVEVLGPLGRGFPLEHAGTPVLVAGGRGVAPLLFVADELATVGRACEFLVGARDTAHLVGIDDAERRTVDRGGRLHVCTDDGSRGERGNVVALLDRLSSTFAPPLVIHACGPHAMLKAVAGWAAEHGTAAFVAMESVMACGTGVCRGCPLPRSRSGRVAFGDEAPSLLGSRDYAMCCTEGPVFESGGLDWERIE